MAITAGILFLLCVLAWFVRWARWLGVVQQKEYRLDRIMLFLRSREGVIEVLRIIPFPKDYTRAGLKRPKLTSRVVTILVISFGISVVAFFYAWLQLVTIHQFDDGNLFLPSAALLIIHVLTPLFIFIATIPTAVITAVLTTAYLQRAARLLQLTHPKIIGITGSYGKTSTRQLLVHCIGQTHSVFSPPRSYNTKLGVATSILSGYHDQEYVVLEYGAYAPGEIATLARYFKPDMVVLTGFSPQHLGLFGSEPAIAIAKGELVNAAPAQAPVYYNADDPNVQKIIDAAGRSDISLHPYEASHAGAWTFSRLTDQGYVQFEWSEETITTRMVGLHYLSNISGAVTVAADLGVGEAVLQKAIQEYQPADHVIRLYATKNDVTVLDDGDTTNPAGFSAALDTLAAMPQQPKIIITAGIIDLGTRSDEIHQALAEKTAGIADQVLYVGEAGKAVFASVLGKRCITVPAAVSRSIADLPAGSIICIEGRVPPWLQVTLDQLG